MGAEPSGPRSPALAGAGALGLGARSFVEPRDIETVGRFAVLADPTGGVFALFKASKL